MKQKVYIYVFVFCINIFENAEILFKICSYTQNCTLILKLTAHNTKHTQYTKLHLQKSNLFQNLFVFQQKKHSHSNQRAWISSNIYIHIYTYTYMNYIMLSTRDLLNEATNSEQ